MCNLGSHKIMQEDIKMVVKRELLTSAHAQLKRMPVITKMLRNRNKYVLVYDNPVAGAAIEAEETLHARVSKRLFQ